MSDENDRTTRLRIDFQVREVPRDPNQSLPDKDLRYVTFGDFVEPADIRDFFERCGIACETMFAGMDSGTVIYSEKPCPSSMKIPLIKMVREWTNLGLKDAKDLVESPLRTPLCVFKNVREAKTALANARAYWGSALSDSLEIRGCSYEDLVKNGAPGFYRRNFSV